MLIVDGGCVGPRVSEWSRYRREQEWIFSPGSTFIVTEVFSEKHKQVLGKKHLQMFTLRQVQWRKVIDHDLGNAITRLTQQPEAMDDKLLCDCGTLRQAVLGGQPPDSLLQLICNSLLVRNRIGREVGRAILRNTTPDASGRMPAHRAAISGKKMLLLIVHLRDDPNQKDKDGKAPGDLLPPDAAAVSSALAPLCPMTEVLRDLQLNEDDCASKLRAAHYNCVDDVRLGSVEDLIAAGIHRPQARRIHAACAAD
eukprot:gene57725-biopygen32737